MNYTEHKKMVRSALKMAINDRRCSEIARKIERDPGTVHSFARSGNGGEELVEKLYPVLVDYGYLEQPEKQPKEEKPPDKWNPIASELRGLADILVSGYPDNFKTDKFITWVKVTFKNLDDIVTVLKRSQ